MERKKLKRKGSEKKRPISRNLPGKYSTIRETILQKIL